MESYSSVLWTRSVRITRECVRDADAPESAPRGGARSLFERARRAILGAAELETPGRAVVSAQLKLESVLSVKLGGAGDFSSAVLRT